MSSFHRLLYYFPTQIFTLEGGAATMLAQELQFYSGAVFLQSRAILQILNHLQPVCAARQPVLHGPPSLHLGREAASSVPRSEKR